MLERVNGGYAHRVNAGLRRLLEDGALDMFWVLNPDCRFAPDAAFLLRKAGDLGPFSLMGGRTVYDERPDLIQTDGGRVSRLSGQCRSLNARKRAASTRAPWADQIDLITGASCVASRRFLETVGLMHEDYFLYYEKVDRAFRRGDLELRFVPEVEIRHIGGTAIGSGSWGRRASPFSNYFNFRSRMIFLRCFMPSRLPIGMAHAIAKAAHVTFQGYRREAWSILSAILGLEPPREVRERLSRETLALVRNRSKG